MASAFLNSAFNAFHAYVYGTSIWYFIRGCARLAAPITVFNWFQNDGVRNPTSLELYNIRTDGIGLLALAFLTLALSGANVPFLTTSLTPPSKMANGTKTSARAAILYTIAHHLGTALFAYLQWADPHTATGAMLLGWAYSSGISVLGVAAWFEIGKAVDDGPPASRTRKGAKSK